MKATFATLLIFTLGASAKQTLAVTHEPLSLLWNSNGDPQPVDTLNLRWKTLGDEHTFRKRSNRVKCRSPSPEPLVSNILDGVGNLVDDLHKGATHWIMNGWHHDHKFGIVTSKTENDVADNEFLVTIEYGSPRPQKLKMVFDTGSPDSWVYSPACCYTNNHSVFDPSKSRTYRNRTIVAGQPVKAPKGTEGTPFYAAYASNSATAGYVGYETFHFNNDKLDVKDLPLALATNMTGSRSNRGMEGLIGLSTGNGSEVQGGWTTPFEAMSQRGLLNQTYLTATLIKANRDTGKGGGGQYTFGEVDDWKLSGEITWSNVISAYLWGAYFDKLSIGDLILSQKPATDLKPIRYLIDTGGALLLLPEGMAAQANAAIAGNYKTTSTKTQVPYLIPCATGTKTYEASLETKNNPLTITLEGRTFSVPMADHVFYPHSPLPPAEAGGRQGMCYSAIQAGPGQFTVLGLTFLKNHVVVFDQGGKTLQNRRMGIGKRTDITYDV